MAIAIGFGFGFGFGNFGDWRIGIPGALALAFSFVAFMVEFVAFVVKDYGVFVC